MFLVSLARSLVFAAQSFWRNIWLSLATIFIITLTLISINFLIVINAVSESAIAAVKDRIDVSVYFLQDVREDKIAEVKSHLETLPQVQSITYYSPSENLLAFKERYKNDNNIQETLAELEGNPLGGTLVIKAKTLAGYPDILEAVDNPAYASLIESKSYDDNQTVIKNINLIADNVKKGGWVISGLFVLIAILIVFNTVRIAIFTHRNEVTVMKLVGAGNWFIRSPFILENIFSGIIASILSLSVVYFLLSLVQPQLSNFFGGVEFNLIGYFNDNFLLIYGSQLLGIVLLSLFSSALAIGKYLNV